MKIHIDEANRTISGFNIRTQIIKATPREIFKNYTVYGEELPIRGGWGYSREDSIIINKYDPCLDPHLPFDGVALEYMIIPYRLDVELIASRFPGKRYVQIKYDCIRQEIFHHENQSYDHLTVAGTCLQEVDYTILMLKRDNSDHPDFDMKAFEQKKKAAQWHFTTEYFFDISSFYGQSG